MDKKTILLIALSCICLLEGFLYISNKISATDSEYLKSYQENNRIYSIILPDKVEFAGESVPMNLFYVREGLDRELSVNAYWQSSTLLMLKKANRFFPAIEPILKKNNIPDDFKYLALIESGLSNTVSPSGAAGFWQFLKETGKRYGLEITEEVDERYELEKSTVAACKMLSHSYDLFGSWSLCAAAFNAGESRISAALKNQAVNSFYDLYLNQETSRYLFRIIAMKLIYEHPTEFGYMIRNKDLYPLIPTEKLAVDTTINDLAAFSKKQGINYRLLKEFNPWLRKEKLTVQNGHKYYLTLPQKGYEKYDLLLKELKDPERLFNDTLTRGRLFK